MDVVAVGGDKLSRHRGLRPRLSPVSCCVPQRGYGRMRSRNMSFATGASSDWCAQGVPSTPSRTIMLKKAEQGQRLEFTLLAEASAGIRGRQPASRLACGAAAR